MSLGKCSVFGDRKKTNHARSLLPRQVQRCGFIGCQACGECACTDMHRQVQAAPAAGDRRARKKRLQRVYRLQDGSEDASLRVIETTAKDQTASSGDLE